MSNRFEIQQELTDTQGDLNRLCQKEARQCRPTKSNSGTVTIEPRYGKEMNALREKCGQLRMILDAMEASED
ncbi:hypothetical protein LOOC260_113520 [Paucilactobacillus hokkaidonensis JCM 18461]|uniref:Uncharacterized protein n=2 Tax=Paucilactobacillus hokkaidonensis TaxID=1193095 RepID=A0A0A1GY73_9LACO|nr:hypothetical protein [Paucilactobacillus hokkaidonensis]KRO09907.1 hypothetical protein IV59_GL000214 [Paucilactobacillus hokkaidonensis]BAP85888.1 hypothetical protein LOOC260_113520 [Paucilactobacillus hokkaidonensis JCM 18461]